MSKSFLDKIPIFGTYANSADADQGLHCLLILISMHYYKVKTFTMLKPLKLEMDPSR